MIYDNLNFMALLLDLHDIWHGLQQNLPCPQCNNGGISNRDLKETFEQEACKKQMLDQGLHYVRGPRGSGGRGGFPNRP